MLSCFKAFVVYKCIAYPRGQCRERSCCLAFGVFTALHRTDNSWIFSHHQKPWVVFCMNAAFTGCVSASPRPLKTELLFWNLILTTENPRRHCGQAQRSFLSPWKSIKWGNSILLNSKLYTLQLGVKMSPRKKQYRIMSFPTNWRLYCLKLHVSFFCKRTLNILGLTLGRLYIADIPWQ